MLGAAGGQGTFNPTFEWNGQVLFSCVTPDPVVPSKCQKFATAPEQVLPAGEYRSCTNDPGTNFRCTGNPSGCSCEGKCLPFGNFPQECLTVAYALEDNWAALNMRVLHRPGPTTAPIEYANAPNDRIRVVIESNFGRLNAFDSIHTCGPPPVMDPNTNQWVKEPSSKWVDAGGTPHVWQCAVTISDMASPPAAADVPEVVLYEEIDIIAQGINRRRLTIMGPFNKMDAGIKSLKYLPDPNMNTIRLRNSQYVGRIANDFAYEYLNATVFFQSPTLNNGNVFIPVGTPLIQMIHIVSTNDQPTIRNPNSLYTPPDECADAASEDYFCNFGQLWSIEDTSTPVVVSGVLIEDIDLYEECSEEIPTCSNLDVGVKTFKGAVQLNTRSNLNFYTSERSQVGFTATDDAVDAAVKVLFYRVETDDLANTLLSTVLNYNTQRGAALEQEFITVSVSDQGFTGASGVAQTNEIQIPIVVVADNDAPVIYIGVSEYSALEDVVTQYPPDELGLPIFFADIDLDEKIDSLVALKNWMGMSGRDLLLNKIQLTASLEHGALKFGYVRNLRIAATQKIQYATFSWANFGHDLCRVSELMTDRKLLRAATGGAYDGTYSDFCTYSNIGSSFCPTGAESTCTCDLEGTCRDGGLILFLNRTRTSDLERNEFLSEVAAATDKVDRSCGGMPVFPKPNNFTQGRSCTSFAQCADDALPKCKPGIDCFCCANISHVCQSFADCKQFDIGSQCGCTPGGGGPSAGGGTCGPYFFNKQKTGAQTTNLVRIGAEYGGVLPELTGHDCVFAGTGSEVCRAAAYVLEGTAQPNHVQTVSIESLGSSYVQLVGSMVDVNRALENMYYITDAQFNRLWRLPPALRDPLTFDIEADSLEKLTIVANDLGNSGGGKYDPRTAERSVFMRINAINDRPSANAPDSVTAYEDQPLHFLATSLNANDLPPGSTYETYSKNPLHAHSINMTDPDFEDYGFSTRRMTLNISCTHGRLYLNEDFLKLPGVAGERIEFKIWDSQQERRGVTSVVKDALGAAVLGPDGIPLNQPVYGDGCQFKASCTDGIGAQGEILRTPDVKYGFFQTPWYGKVFSPQPHGNPPQLKSVGCGICPENSGNKFVSMVGVYADLNLALARVTYLPDPHFNTRSASQASVQDGTRKLQEETIVFQVSDDGAIGNDDTAAPLTDEKRVSVTVESVNDRPIIGRRVSRTRQINSYDGGLSETKTVTDFEVEPIDKSLDSLCFSLCNSTNALSGKAYIDIDEDTLFMVGPEVLWIADVDSGEADRMPDPTRRRYTCPPAGDTGCRCGLPCLCGIRPCACDIPEVCQGNAGKLLVNFQVDQGQLSMYPPPGRELFSADEMTFLTNETEVDLLDGGSMVPCPGDMLSCMRNVSRLSIRTSLANLQLALEQYFLTYIGKPDFAGLDVLRIWVSDAGMTDDAYNTTLVAQETINIRVVAVNDAPVATIPNRVLQFPKGQRCFSDFMAYIAVNELAMLPECFDRVRDRRDTSAIPPAQFVAGTWVAPTDFIVYRDIDMDDAVPIPPKTTTFSLTITIGNDAGRHGASGSFFFSELLENTRMWHEIYLEAGLTRMYLEGRLEDVNRLLANIKYDADETYQGYVPLVLFASDNRWYGECSGDHECGSDKPCVNHLTAEPHQPSRVGTRRTIVDVTVRAPEKCKSTTCKPCNAEPGCGWCATACPEQGGKCMIASADGSSPKFEQCDTGKVTVNGTTTTLSWRQCEATPFDLITTVGAAVGSVVVFAIFFYVFRLWVLRRHGNFLTYFKKKRADVARVIYKMSLLPPPDADYWQFTVGFVCIVVTVAVVVVLGGPVVAPNCIFTQQYFLDKASSMTLNLDNCNVRFLPARTQPSPDNELDGAKIKFSIKSDPNIKLEGEWCGEDVKFTVNNSLASSVKYIGYYCSVEILVPDRFVLPEMHIHALGDNITTVRGGPMDKDTPDFGLDFGPNRFRLTGSRLEARLQNVTAKLFSYEADHGSLTAVNLRTTEGGLFRSKTSDLVVTTPVATSVRFWQKAANRVCLTAAPGSLYVDDSCNNVCEIRTSNATNSSSTRRSFPDPYAGPSLDAPPLPPAPDAATYAPYGDLDERRQLGSETFTLQGLVITDPVAGDPRTPWKCTGEPGVDEQWQCELFNATKIALDAPCPEGSKYRFKYQVRQIPDCTDLDTCFEDESSKCLCKPLCDMANLDPPGVCDDAGRCCQVLCAGFSRADMFPVPNQPRCGLDISPDLQWCTNDLEQKWTFESDEGQMSVQVLEGCDPMSPGKCGCEPQADGSYDFSKCMGMETVSSYAGSAPNMSFVNLNEDDAVPTNVGIETGSATILNKRFHQNALPAPTEEWFTININGPGAPAPSVGEFVWIRTIRHAVLPPWLMEFMSYGILSPEKADSTVGLRPGFCPAFVDPSTAAFNRRLSKMQKALLTVVQDNPGSSTPIVIPFGSMIAFIATEDLPKIFLTDTKTGKVSVVFVEPFNYPLLVSLLALGLLIPLLTATVITLALFFTLRTYLYSYRRAQVLNEVTMRQISSMLGKGIEIDEDQIPRENYDAMRDKTNFFHMYEHFIGTNSLNQSPGVKAFTVVCSVTIIVLPLIFTLVITKLFDEAYRSFACTKRQDKCVCFSETIGVLWFPKVIEWHAYEYFFISMLELLFHYLAVTYNKARRLLRFFFYLNFFMTVWIGAAFVFMVTTFVFLGVLVDPTGTAPYAISVVGAAGVAGMIYAKMIKYQIRVQRGIGKRLTMYKTQASRRMPPALLDALMGRNIQAALREHGLATPTIVITVALFLGVMAAIYTILFYGFVAFTDQSDLDSGLLNDFILIIVLVIAYQTMVAEADSEALRDRIDVTVEQIMGNLNSVLGMVEEQIELAEKLVAKMRKQMEDEYGDNEYESSEEYSDEEVDQVQQGQMVARHQEN